MKTENAKMKSITESDMKTKRLGNSDLYITPIGFGAWAIGGSGWEFAWGGQDDSDSVAAIHEALDAGVNWIDTAAVYGLGHSEAIVVFVRRTRWRAADRGRLARGRRRPGRPAGIPQWLRSGPRPPPGSAGPFH